MEPMIRGYSVKQQLNFLETQFEPAVSEKLVAQIPQEVRRHLAEVKPAEWYPRQYSVHVLRAIAAHSGKDERAVQADLVRCGIFISTEATNTFLKILMKMLTPALFGKKIPDFWSRDMKGGRFEVDVSKANERRIQLALCDVEGFDHIGVVSIGWISFGMQAMGKSDVKIVQQGWSLATPGANKITYDLSWS
jgi:hypothetical protein